MIQSRLDGCLIPIQVVPRAGQSRIAGRVGDSWKVRIAAPPVEGAANEECVRFLAQLFKIPKSNVTLRSGEHSRRKVVFLKGINAVQAEAILKNTK